MVWAKSKRRSAPALLGAALAALAVAPPCVAQEGDPGGEAGSQDAAPVAANRYLRLVEEAGVLSLELRVRELRAVDDEGGVFGPRIYLTAAMHVGERRYYEALQELLDGCDVVLYERVEPEPPGGQALSGLAPVERARVLATRRRLEAIALLVAAHVDRMGADPESLDALADGLGRDQDRAARALARDRVDAWGRPVAYAAGEQGFRLTSLGADGRPGGEGAGADLVQEGLPPEALRASVASLPQEIADALGLVFQLDGIDYNDARWRNSDMSFEQLVAALEARGLDADALLGTLAGDSLASRVAMTLFKLVGSSRSGAALIKIVGIEVLARADELIAALPPDMAPLFDVLIDGRNDLVARDLGKLLTSEPGVESIGVFYGAAHMADLERRLVAELGLRPVGERWLAGVQLRLTDTGMAPGQVAWMRRMIGRSLDRSLRGR